MRVSKIFKKENGDRYEVNCDFTDSLNSPIWNVTVFKCPKGKRKFVNISNVSDYRYDGLSLDEKKTKRIREYQKEIPWSWVEEVMDEMAAKIRELGNALKPKI